MNDLIEFKNRKKLKLIIKELDECEKRLSASIELLKNYRKYIPIMESLTILHNSRTLININISKYKRMEKVE